MRPSGVRFCQQFVNGDAARVDRDSCDRNENWYTGAMTLRSVVDVITSHRQSEGGGFIVRRPFPTMSVDNLDPFLLLDEMGPTDYRPGEAVGAPDHPHRGFETVTYMLSGGMEHRDSTGAHGVIRPGAVQWMTAGAGVVHSETPTGRHPARRRSAARVPVVGQPAGRGQDDPAPLPGFRGRRVHHPRPPRRREAAGDRRHRRRSHRPGQHHDPGHLRPRHARRR